MGTDRLNPFRRAWRALVPPLPVLRLMAPTSFTAGQTLVLRVLVDCPREGELEALDLSIQQMEVYGDGESVRWKLHADLSGPRHLPTGRTAFSGRVTIPSDALPDYDGAPHNMGAVRTVAVVRAHVPRRLDVRTTFQVPVALTAAPERASSPVLYSSRAANAPRPYMEVSLDRSVVPAGGTLSGRVSIRGAHASEVTVHIVRETRPRSGWPLKALLWTYRLPTRVSSGASAPFSFALPSILTPSFDGRVLGIGWHILIRASSPAGVIDKIAIPIEVTPPSTTPANPVARRAAPMVGDERIDRVWKNAADHSGARLVNGAIEGQAPGGVHFRVHHAAHPTLGAALHGTIRYPNLGIDLDGGVRSGFKRLGTTASVDELGKVWNRMHYGAARELPQARAYLSGLLGGFEHLRVADVDDESLTIELPSRGDEPQELQHFVASIAEMARRQAHTAIHRVPLPERFHSSGAAWGAAAEELRATLFPGPPMLVALDETWSLSTRWVGDEPITVWAVAPRANVDERIHFRSSIGELPSQLSTDARKLAQDLLGKGTLAVEDTKVELTIARATLDPAAERELLQRLMRFAASLRVDDGPFR